MIRVRVVMILLSFVFLNGCGLPPLGKDVELPSDYTYIIGPGDSLNIFVWDNPDISRSVTVRPDGKINTPLVDDLMAAGLTPSELSLVLEKGLAKYVRDPLVSVSVSGFQGMYEQQVRIVGQISGGSGGGSGSGSGNRYSAKAFPYKKGMSLLDLMIELGGIGEYADGNRSTIIRKIDGEQQQFGIKIDDLIEDGDLAANIDILPGDILIIPEAFF